MSTPRFDDVTTRLARALGAGYEVRELVGHGGFASVFAAFDLSLKRDVAVKVLRAELAGDAGMRLRFRREAEAVARLRHPHIVPIYGVGESDDLVWYVMPLIHGPSLRIHLERVTRLTIPDARRVLAEAAAALATAHRAGIVHRDIKPDNILLDGPDARVLLTDFGIAKALTPEPGVATLTQTGVVIGTPQYMSPEQATGEATDARSDIYSLGVVAYQMLAGALPFEAATVAALLLKHVTGDAPSIIHKRPDCPSDLAGIVMRCLAKTPEQRWASAEELQQALAAAVPTGAAVARRSSGSGRQPVRPAPLARLRRTVLVAAGLLAATGAVDIVRQRVALAPLGLLVGAFAIALEYGRLWTAGYVWRDLLAGGRVGGSTGTPPLDSAEFGAQLGAIQQARADRAALRGALERVPRAARTRYERAVHVADDLLAQAATLARQVVSLERQIEPGAAEIERRLAATAAEPPSPGRAQRLAVLERRRETVHGLAARRDQVADRLTRVLRALASLRAAVETGGGAQEIAGALEDAEAAFETS